MQDALTQLGQVLTAQPVLMFNTQAFLVFFAVVFTLYWAVPLRRWRAGLLLAASVYFYATWNKELALVVCGTALLDYLLARVMDRSEAPRWRKLLLVCSLVVNLGTLCYFKYRNFFVDSLDAAFAAAGGANDWSLVKEAFAPQWVLIRDLMVPVGLSFYTFEAISYTVDVYRRRIKAETNLAHFMVFILFFPHLVAGPIVRARDFLPQLRRPKRWDWLRLQLGVQYFLMGLFKKMAIADRMAIFADPVFKDPGQFSSGTVWVAVVAYTLQIYCDFSGYSDMAIGIAHSLGYKLAPNFNMPYLARNVQEFWHRWHISLSSWLRDYLFISLGGSRCSAWKTARNLMVTMTLGGLWHGANWTFIVWGVLHGALLVVHRWFKAFCKTRPRLDRFLQTPPGATVCWGTTLLAVMFGWVFFRAQSFAVALEVFRRMFIPCDGPTPPPLHPRSLWYTVAVVALCHALAMRGHWKRAAPRLPAPVMGFGYAVVLTLALVLAPDEGKAFIYFQF
jgi:alginate O-acetyltransferase complex protein AlgI